MHFRHKFLQKPPPTFSMVHLLHRLYGVDAHEPNDRTWLSCRCGIINPQVTYHYQLPTIITVVEQAESFISCACQELSSS